MPHYVPTPQGLDSALRRVLDRHGAEVAAEISGVSRQTLFSFAEPHGVRKQINERMLDQIVTRFALDPNLMETLELAPPPMMKQEKDCIMTDPIMQQIDRHCDLHDYEVTITYTAYVEAHSEDDAVDMAHQQIRDLVENDTPDIDVYPK